MSWRPGFDSRGPHGAVMKAFIQMKGSNAREYGGMKQTSIHDKIAWSSRAIYGEICRVRARSGKKTNTLQLVQRKNRLCSTTTHWATSLIGFLIALVELLRDALDEMDTSITYFYHWGWQDLFISFSPKQYQYLNPCWATYLSNWCKVNKVIW